MTSVLLSLFLAQSGPVLIDKSHPAPKPGKYLFIGDRTAAWTIRGHDFSLDLSARELVGAPEGTEQDSLEGVGLLLDGCKNVTIKNLSVSRYKVNVMLKNCHNVRLINIKANQSKAIRISRNGKPVDTFLNVRNLDAWRAYGAGIWMESSDICRIERCTAQFSQNGLVMVGDQHCEVVQNMFSFNGGWGVALWDSNRNVVAWNHADFCNRPWAGGWGGDAAGVAVVNNCTGNYFVNNSLTHGGDGFFLSDRVNGGYDEKSKTYRIVGSCNRNVAAYNDGSWSSNNAFEATFSKANAFYKNIANDSNYGFWLGFSQRTFLNSNEVQRNASDGVAIGQGATNTLFRNFIEHCGGVGVNIWSDAGPVQIDQPSDGNVVIENRIADCKIGIRLERSTHPEILSNTIERAETSPTVPRGFASFARAQLLTAWTFSHEANHVSTWHNRRPTSWVGYRDSKGPKGKIAIKLGDYSPVP